MSQNYDPSKHYSWTPEDKFELTGDQFGTILNGLRAIVATPESQRLIAIMKANDVIENLMAKGVEDGTVLQTPDPNNKNGTTGLTIKK